MDLRRPEAGSGGVSGWVLDVSALVAFGEATAYAESVRYLARRIGRTLLVPLPALAAAAQRRSGRKHAERLAALVAEPAVVTVDGAEAAGPRYDRLVDRARGDRLAALVVMLAIERGWPILSDRGDALCRLRPDLYVIPS